MKTVQFLSTAIFAYALIFSCSSDDPLPVEEEEVITTMNVTLIPQEGGSTVELRYFDLDGEGGDPPLIDNGVLVTGVTYNGSIVLLNETGEESEDVTEEVEMDSNNHQFFYTPSESLDVTTFYENFDDNDHNLGTEFTLVAGAMGSGELTFTLIHEPNKPNTGLGDAEGEAGGTTDIEATFELSIQ